MRIEKEHSDGTKLAGIWANHRAILLRFKVKIIAIWFFVNLIKVSKKI